MIAPELAATIGVYDRVRRANSSPQDPRTATGTFAAALPPASVVLDAGCGAGVDLAVFRAAGHHVVGVDLSAGMVCEAAANGPVVQGDLVRLPFPDAVFDACWLSASLVHLDEPSADAALREVRRVLRPGGPLEGSVKSRTDDGPAGRWIDDTIGRRWFWLPTVAELDALLRRCGFDATVAVQGPAGPGLRWLCFVA